MAIYLKQFETQSAYEAAEGWSNCANYILPIQ